MMPKVGTGSLGDTMLYYIKSITFMPYERR